jgi:hypothetical protein
VTFRQGNKYPTITLSCQCLSLSKPTWKPYTKRTHNNLPPKALIIVKKEWQRDLEGQIENNLIESCGNWGLMNNPHIPIGCVYKIKQLWFRPVGWLISAGLPGHLCCRL